MRPKTMTNVKMVRVDGKVHDQLIKDKSHFENIIGGGLWSMNDTIKEYQKILKGIKK